MANTGFASTTITRFSPTMPERCAGFASVPASATGSSSRCRPTIWNVGASVIVTSPTVPPCRPVTAPIFADAELGALEHKRIQVRCSWATRRAGRRSAPDLKPFPRHRINCGGKRTSSSLRRSYDEPGDCVLIIQFLAVFAERLVAGSRDTIVRRYPEPKPAFGIGVVKGLFLGIVSGDF